jgi:hypothetical protein
VDTFKKIKIKNFDLFKIIFTKNEPSQILSLCSSHIFTSLYNIFHIPSLRLVLIMPCICCEVKKLRLVIKQLHHHHQNSWMRYLGCALLGCGGGRGMAQSKKKGGEGAYLDLIYAAPSPGRHPWPRLP